ncbi:hypothetical protein CXG81DRAFT_28179, partial [Caulochytrium protostelioides]
APIDLAVAQAVFSEHVRRKQAAPAWQRPGQRPHGGGGAAAPAAPAPAGHPAPVMPGTPGIPPASLPDSASSSPGLSGLLGNYRSITSNLAKFLK